MQYQRRLLPSISMLIAFDAAARAGNFTAAAHELKVTQGAVSRQISALENQLGVELFRRDHKPLQLSNAGKIYAAEIHTALQSIRNASLAAIAKPQTDDPGDDEYSYGFRLWDAGFFPEAQQQLTLFVEKYPDHPRATFGRNLLGRAYLDDGKPSEAAPWFLRNYQADKNAARAGDSLLFLAESMIALDDTQRACIALSEFAETYPALATGRLQGRYATARSKVTCG